MPSIEQVFHTIPIEWQDVVFEYLLRGSVVDAASRLNLERLNIEERRWKLLRGYHTE
jgi:hypothetical protein